MSRRSGDAQAPSGVREGLFTNTYLNVTRAELVESMRRADEARNRYKIIASWTENGPRPPCNDEQENAENTLLH